ncbi:MAG TPA: hypothetical protein PLH37_03155 [bacterium]|nr:hypothetical protein [bacterium]
MRKKDYSQHHNHAGVKHAASDCLKNKKNCNSKLYFILSLIIILGIILGIFFFSPFFKIKKITLSGTNNGELLNQVEKLAFQFINENNYKYVSLLNDKKLSVYLIANAPLDAVVIKKQLPNKIIITITPKIPACLWQEGESYYLINNLGIPETPVLLSQVAWDLPIVSAATTTNINLHQPLINEYILNFIKNFFKECKKSNINTEITKYVVPNLSGGEVRALTKSGWYFILNTDNGVEATISTIKNIMENKFKDTAPKEYIDLRIPSRIFYK